MKMLQQVIRRLYLAIVICMALTQCRTNTPTKQDEPSLAAVAPTTITDTCSADHILSDYYNNEVRADDLHKGKQVVVIGVVNSINKGMGDDIYLMVRPRFHNCEIQCLMKNSIGVAALKRHQLIKLQGQCDGLLLGTLIIKDCSLMEMQ